jgi:hypothetical protein
LFGVDFFEVGEALAGERVRVAQNLHDVVVARHGIKAATVFSLVVEVNRRVGSKFSERVPRSAVAEQFEVGQIDARR